VAKPTDKADKPHISLSWCLLPMAKEEEPINEITKTV
jgi:hypothetical protein